jgi:hypothetical protein
MRLDTLLIILTLPVVAGCANYQIEKNTPIFLDTKKGYGRIYSAEKIKPEQCGAPDYIFKYTNKNIPIDQMNGYVCLSADQVQYNLRYYNDFLKRKANCQ